MPQTDGFDRVMEIFQAAQYADHSPGCAPPTIAGGTLRPLATVRAEFRARAARIRAALSAVETALANPTADGAAEAIDRATRLLAVDNTLPCPGSIFEGFEMLNAEIWDIGRAAGWARARIAPCRSAVRARPSLRRAA